MTSPMPVLPPESEADLEQPAPEPEEEEEQELGEAALGDVLYQHPNGFYEVRVLQPIRNEE